MTYRWPESVAGDVGVPLVTQMACVVSSLPAEERRDVGKRVAAYYNALPTFYWDWLERQPVKFVAELDRDAVQRSIAIAAS